MSPVTGHLSMTCSLLQIDNAKEDSIVIPIHALTHPHCHHLIVMVVCIIVGSGEQERRMLSPTSFASPSPNTVQLVHLPLPSSSLRSFLLLLSCHCAQHICGGGGLCTDSYCVQGPLQCSHMDILPTTSTTLSLVWLAVGSTSMLMHIEM
jgi:hypothetical protein